MANDIKEKAFGESGAAIFAEKIKNAQKTADGKYSKPESGIPKSDFSEEVKSALDKADSALQSIPGDVVRDNDISKVAKSGSYNDLTDIPEEPTVATAEKAGIVRLGSDEVQEIKMVEAPGKTADRTYPVQVNEDGQLVVNVPWNTSTPSLSATLDTRNENTTPNDYKVLFKVSGLKSRTAVELEYDEDRDGVNLGSFVYPLGLRPWWDSSVGNAHELGFESGEGGGIFHRIGKTDTWGPWTRLLETSNLGFEKTGNDYPVQMRKGKMFVNVPPSGGDGIAKPLYRHKVTIKRSDCYVCLVFYSHSDTKFTDPTYDHPMLGLENGLDDFGVTMYGSFVVSGVACRPVSISRMGYSGFFITGVDDSLNEKSITFTYTESPKVTTDLVSSVL